MWLTTSVENKNLLKLTVTFRAVFAVQNIFRQAGLNTNEESVKQETEKN